MMQDWFLGKRAFIAVGFTDLRRGIDGLAAIVQEEFKLDPFDTGCVFLFCGRKRDRIKVLVYDGDGFVLAYKRLEANGSSFKWPRSQREARELTPQQFRWLMEGLELEQKKAIQPVERVQMF